MDATYNMDVDDLFGDSENVTLQAINVASPVKGLSKRIDELGASGCCQKIAWSKNGCVAYISPDGYTANLKVFSRDTETGKWDLRKDVPLDVPQGREQFPFVHLSWSHLGNDLALMDAAGRVMVFSCAMALDRMQFIRAELAHPEAEVDGVVGMHWLAIHPYEAKNNIAWSTTRDGNKWQWHVKSHMFNDAFHPLDGKASLIYLKRHGELKLRFQQNDSSWQEVSAQSAPLMSTKEPFTHAAFSSNNDATLLLVAYDVARRLHLYRVEIVWNVPQDKRNANAGPFDKPVLNVSLLSIEDDCDPIGLINGDLRGAAAAQLTHLNFLPTTPEDGDGSSPTIQAIFCRPPNIISSDQLQENPYSVIVRWGVRHIQQTQLHSSLDQVTSKKKSVGSISAKTISKLDRQPDFPLHSVVLTTYPLWYNMLLAFSYNDGTIEFRKRGTMEVIMPDGNTETMTSLLQAGFAFPHAEPSLHVALSPSHCIAVCMQQDGTIKLRSMEYQHGTLSSDDDDPRHSAALAALVLQSSSAANQYYSSDDVFSIIGSLSEKRTNDFIDLLFDGLQVNIDCGVHDQNGQHLVLLGRSPFFVKTLSAMNLLGLHGPANRSLSSKIAWINLNIKYITQILTTIMRMHGNIEKTSLRPEVVPQFIGICRWILHFMAYLMDDLFTIGRAIQDLPSQSLTRETLEQKMHALNKPAVLILLSAFPRAMMKLWHQPIGWVKKSAETLAGSAGPNQPPISLDIRKLYTPLYSAVNEVPFDYRWFDGLVNDTHNHVRAAYKRANLTDIQRNHIERELMLGHIPEILAPIAKRLVTDTLWNDKSGNGCLADKLDMGRLMFFDTTWLGFNESKRAREWHDTHVVDVCQKMIVRGTGKQEHPVTGSGQQMRGRSDSIQSTNGETVLGKKKAQLRQCTRCGAYMEDVMQGTPGYTPHHASWLMGVAKHCVCGNSWMLAPDKMRAK
ncbi:mediator of RNA polymerase II transcription subunit 16 [Parastagonospora nodorum]|nr:mediator of RNA polymerase II transcription subunit 16 [Parastagonospora nodorum]KAH4201307.1 mediator of RNA polymerase II transcription subunit 16 [Parastagonospora nodorum]KAH4300420.1 mediator of RNA polymerase II transcription subunit 16 [Parastagonospora nodorum]KAH4307148.1 mediator of RNA polymerase II transcription subunit 16 [Parastagonospora nodorum]KAH4337102.1 mediator of RNA polymerase II transcription subunit 16 [Parastagonospora nodorum]